MLTGNPQHPSDVRLGLARCRDDLIAQQRARVGGTAVEITDRWISSHRAFPSVILFEIDVERIAVLKFEGDAEGSVDMDGVSLRLGPSQSVEIEPRLLHVLRDPSAVQGVQADKNARV